MSSKLIPAYRGGVDQWECDQMNHMNVQFYMAKASDAFGHLQNALGLTPAVIRETRKGLRFRTMRTQYKSEVRSGTPIYGVAGIFGVHGDEIEGFIHFFNDREQKLSAVYEFTAHFVDFDADTILPLPEPVRRAALNLLDAHDGVYRAGPFSGPVMPKTPLDHLFDSARGSVDVWESDAFGHIEMRHIVAYFSNAATHIINNVGLTRATIRERNLGSAALDYYSEFHAPLRKTAAVLLRSGLIGASGKIFRFGHQLIDLDKERVAVTTTVVGCYFDMTTRKSVALPEEFTRYPKEKLLIAQLSAPA